MRAVRRALLTVVVTIAAALAMAVSASPGAGLGGTLPPGVQTTSYPWVQPPAGTGVTAPTGQVAALTCSSVQPPCWIPLG